jgi:hypothetical protein
MGFHALLQRRPAVEADDLVTVYTAANNVEAEIIKNALKREGIKAFVEGSYQAGEAGLVGIPVTVQVPAEDADRARKYIEHRHKRGDAHPHPHHKPD